MHQDASRRQLKAVIELANRLRKAFPSLDFAIAGIGERNMKPAWITDLRAIEVDFDTEVRWCQRYSESHVVIGVHGSNMILPSAHAGAVIDLMPNNRWSNLGQDILPQEHDVRLATFRYRSVPFETSVETVASIVQSILSSSGFAVAAYSRYWCSHDRPVEEYRGIMYRPANEQ